MAELSDGERRYFNGEDQLKLDAHFEKARKEMPSLTRSREIEMARAGERRVERELLRVWEYFTKPDAYNAEMGRENYPNLSGLPPHTDPAYKGQLMNWATLDLYSSRFLQPVYNDKFGNVIYKIK